ncbi:recombination mediator RecR [bacterium SCSIO 12741]|nr:recombination mediator RecR [bacterium SCSIO 12741]
MDLPSKYLQEAVDEIASLPGIGKKTALRLALHLLRRDENEVLGFSKAIAAMKQNIRHCHKCGNLSDQELCGICSNPARNQKIICLVEDLRDVIAIEATRQYGGLYHVLGGVISPMDGIGPGDLNLGTLLDRIKEEGTEEVIMALNATMEGDTTGFYLYKKIQPLGIKITTIARGVSVGDELHYADEITLGSSIQHRTLFEGSFNR